MHNFEPLNPAMLAKAIEQRAEIPELETHEERSGGFVNITAMKVHGVQIDPLQLQVSQRRNSGTA